MKKLFSIALVIAMAISCLAIFPSAAISYTADSEMYYEVDFINDNTQVQISLIVDVSLAEFNIDEGNIDILLEYDQSQLEVCEGGAFETNIVLDGEPEWYTQDGFAEAGIYLILANHDLPNHITAKATFTFNVLAEAGETISLEDTGSCINFGGKEGRFYPELDNLTFTVPAAAPEYEAPAAAEYQTLAGCELCGTAAGVRFIATVDAAADEFGMYITANGTTVTLSSNDAGFVTKAETADTITFTAVIFSDAKFEVVVFEKYGDTEVKSVAGTN